MTLTSGQRLRHAATRNRPLVGKVSGARGNRLAIRTPFANGLKIIPRQTIWPFCITYASCEER